MTSSASNRNQPNRLKFFIGGGLFFVAVILMVISATKTTSEFFITVRELQESPSKPDNQNYRVSGAVVGESIYYDAETELLHFAIAHIPGDEEEIKALGSLSDVLHAAVNDPANPRLEVLYQGPKPDMLRDEAQAIITGTLNGDGVFKAEELLLKCPTKYEEALPAQVE